MRTDCSLERRRFVAPNPRLAARTRVMATAAARWLADDWALEVSRNVATVAHLDECERVACDVIEVAREAVVHRMQAFGMHCSDPDGCAFAMGRAWIEWSYLERYRDHCRRAADFEGETLADRALQMAAAGCF